MVSIQTTKLITGGLLVSAILVAMLSTASTLAGAIGGNFNPAESRRHQQLADFSTANQAAATNLGAAEFRCDRGFAAERFACRSSARQVNFEALTAARIQYKGSTGNKARTPAR